MYGLSREVSTVLTRIVTTNVEKSAEAEVADFEQVKAKGWMVCNINRRCMFRYELLTKVQWQKRIWCYHHRDRYNQSAAEIKNDGRWPEKTPLKTSQTAVCRTARTVVWEERERKLNAHVPRPTRFKTQKRHQSWRLMPSFEVASGFEPLCPVLQTDD